MNWRILSIYALFAWSIFFVSKCAHADDGPTLFKANCTVCHGDDAKGDGPASIGLNPKPRNLVSDPFKNGDSIEQIANTIKVGLNQMPSFSNLTEKERTDLATYIKSLRKK